MSRKIDRQEMPVNRDDDDGDQYKVDGDDDHLRLWLKTKSSFDQNSTINLLSTADGKTVVAALNNCLVPCIGHCNHLTDDCKTPC